MENEQEVTAPLAEDSAYLLPAPKSKRPILVALLVVAILVLTGFSVWQNENIRGFLSLQQGQNGQDQLDTTDGEMIVPDKVTKIGQDLGLIAREPYGGWDVAPEYYSIGKVQEGEYAGYRRVMAVDNYAGPGGAHYFFVTNDDKKYIVTGDGHASLESPFNAEKVVTKDFKYKMFSDTVVLDSTFSLVRGEVAYDATVGAKDGSTYLFDDFKNKSVQYKKIDNPTDLDGFDFYTYLGFSNEVAQERARDPRYIEYYAKATSDVVLVDASGLATSYHMVFSGKLGTEGAKYLNFSKDSIKMLGLAHYGSYFPAFSNGSVCGGIITSPVIGNVQDDELAKISRLNGVDIYRLKDSEHILNQLQYGVKIPSLPEQESSREVLLNAEGKSYYKNPFGKDKNKETNFALPTLENYVAKNPLLFVKDSWGRWIALGESDYRYEVGGCGKPVVYLYPEEPTKVSVDFASAMDLDVAIPKYSDGWDVLASPDGMLRDLNYDEKDCAEIDASRKGSEYAVEACAKNVYPYIYWAGTSLEKAYPAVAGGWVVAGSELGSFLSSKLDEAGLTTREKTDMLDYWLPALRAKKAPYYRISFLGTRAMNELAPMKISPQPDSLYRIFLDWEPLDSKPTVQLVPQNLAKVVREGFTVVEWGGLKRL